MEEGWRSEARSFLALMQPQTLAVEECSSGTEEEAAWLPIAALTSSRRHRRVLEGDDRGGGGE